MNQELYLCQDIKDLQNAENAMMELRDEQRKPLHLVPGGALSFILDKWNCSNVPESNTQKPSTSQINVELYNENIQKEPTMMNALRIGCLI